MDAQIPPPIQIPPAAPIPSGAVKGSDKIWAMLCHLSIFAVITAFLLPLVVYLAMRDESAYVAANAKEALNFHLSLLIYLFVCGLLVFALVGVPLMGLLILLAFIFALVATIKASDGGCYHYPMIIRFID